MKIFFKTISFILSLSVILSLPTTTFADNLFLEIIEITNEGNNVHISCQCTGNISSKLTLICRGEDNSVLYIGEYSALDYGYFELSFPIISNSDSQQYTLSIGGQDFNTPVSKSFYLFDDGTPQFIVLPDKNTVSDLKIKLKNNNPTFYRDGVLLSNNEIVKSLDTVSLNNGNAIVERMSVVLGDVDLDGDVSATDALSILHHTIDKLTLRGISSIAANVLHNDDISVECALKILHYTVGKITEL